MIQKMKFLAVGTIPDDMWILEVPKLKMCALWVSSQAHSHTRKAWGSAFTFNQLALESPKGHGIVLLPGP